MTKQEFHLKWLEKFASDISAEDIEKYVVSTGNYIWHIFSWELKNSEAYLCGNEARIAFDSTIRKNAIYIDWFVHESSDKLPDSFTASVLDGMTEVYVAADDFSWTYIKTHEDTCGPYFMKLQECED